MTEHIDIIMATHNHLDLTMQAVDALYTHTNGPFTLTAVDDSTDLTPLWLEQFAKEKGNVTLIKNQGKVFKNSNHIWREALKEITNPIVVFITNSSFVRPEWELHPLDILKNNPKVGLVGIKLLDEETRTIWHAGKFFSNSNPFHIGVGEPAHNHTHIRPMQDLNPSVGFYRREALINAIDVDTYIGWRGFEDDDQCLMLRNNGWNIVYCGFSTAYHIESPTRLTGNNDQNKFWEEYNENFRRFLVKWQGRSDLLGNYPG